MDKADSLSRGLGGGDPRLRPRAGGADSNGRGPGHRASGPRRLAGPMYVVTSYETKAECEAARQAAMAKEALSRVELTTERLSDGIKTWDSDRQHYTTFRYLCWLAGAGPAPFGRPYRRKRSSLARRRARPLKLPVGERPVLKLMYAAVIRAADRWRGLSVGEFEQPQLRAIREELKSGSRGAHGASGRASDASDRAESGGHD